MAGSYHCLQDHTIACRIIPLLANSMQHSKTIQPVAPGHTLMPAHMHFVSRNMAHALCEQEHGTCTL
eukprot:1161945-Pelagomonas_calceolata.AAC.10